MTIIVCDGKTMAGDGMMNAGGLICTLDYAKVRVLKDGRIIGMAGPVYGQEAFISWLEGGEAGNAPPLSDDFEAMILEPNGDLHLCDEHGFRLSLPLPQALGSGRDFALGACMAGSTVLEAVEIACKLSTTCGGTIRSFSI
jgi:ATP-dependent protease HslVU (ClpYQ) peptidase subunit